MPRLQADRPESVPEPGTLFYFYGGNELSDLDTLWELQQATSDLHDLEHRLSTKPPGFAETDRKYQEAMEEISALEKERETIETGKRSAERELEIAQETLSKFEGQLMQVKDQVQYAAAWKEIDQARKAQQEIEEKVLEAMTKIEEIDTELASRNEAIEPLRQQHQQEYDEWQGSLGDLQSEAEKAREKVSSIEERLPKNLVAQFHRILDRREGVAVTEVVDGSCSSCRFKVRPMVSQRLRRGEILRCEQCSRIFYLEPVLAS